MSFQRFKKLFVSESDLNAPTSLLRVVNAIQANIEKSFAPLTSQLHQDSTILTNVSLKSGQLNQVNHSLGRKLTGWELCRVRGNATVWDSQDDNLSPHLTLFLHCSSDVVVDLEVF